jgi:hypothetical protein
VEAVLVDRQKVEHHHAKKTMLKIAGEVYPEGAKNPEVLKYMQGYFGLSYARSRKGKEEKVVGKAKGSPGRALLDSMLRDLRFSVKRPSSRRNRGIALTTRTASGHAL